MRVIKKNRTKILYDPDIVLYNKRDGGSLVYGKTINGKDYVIAVRTGGNPNKQVQTYEATGFMLSKKVEDRYKKLLVLYKKQLKKNDKCYYIDDECRGGGKSLCDRESCKASRYLEGGVPVHS